MTKIDTSGYVIPTPDLNQTSPVGWPDLPPFTQGYIEALFAALTVDVDFIGEWVVYLALAGSEQRDPAFSDLAPETLARIIEDCEIGVTFMNHEIQSDPETGAKFWRDRQAGMWEDADFPPLTVQLGDDVKVRFA